MNRKNLKNYLAIGLLVGVIGITILQILNANSTTKTESALFNILQFIFSVGFSWVISSYFSDLSFNESQKKFAIGAFRRIKEIERSIGRAQHLLTSGKSAIDGEQDNNHNAIMISLLNAQDAVNSSVADLGDIIGDEIHLTKEIERLKGLRKSSDKFEREYLDNLKTTNKSDLNILKKIIDLKSELPASLSVEDEKDDDEYHQYELAESMLRQEIADTGKIELRGLWEGNDSFNGDLSNTKSGDTLYISRGFTENRSNVITVFDKYDNLIGIITNKFINEDGSVQMDYPSFVDCFEYCIDYKLLPKQFGGKPLPITVTEINGINENGYQHFRAYLSVDNLPHDKDKAADV